MKLFRNRNIDAFRQLDSLYDIYTWHYTVYIFEEIG